MQAVCERKFYENWDMVYALQFSENNFGCHQKIKYSNVDVNYKLASAQVSLQLSYVLVENHLSWSLDQLFRMEI
jgi:hemolysin activation/secretion protein